MKKIDFHSFGMSDVDDPEIYAAIPLGEFMSSPKGQWIKENCKDPMYRIRPDNFNWGNRIIVYGEVEDIAATEYYLKWHNV